MIRIFIVILVILFTSGKGFAQTETQTITESTADTIENDYDKLLRYFLVEKEEIKRLFKFNIVEWAQFNPTISLEQKVGYWSSFELEFLIAPAYKTYTDQEVKILIVDDNLLLSDIDAKYTDIQLNLDYRFYLTKKRRERFGKLTNGFTGAFFLVGGGISFDNKISNNPISQSTYQLVDDSGLLSDIKQQYYNYDISYKFRSGLGYQRRIGKIGYIEFRGGVICRFFQDYQIKQNIHTLYDKGYYFEPYLVPLEKYSQEVKPFIDINMGFALKSFKRPLFR
jgi:hypothetical protein